MTELSHVNPPLWGGVGEAGGGAGARSAEVSAKLAALPPFDLSRTKAPESSLPQRGRLGEPERPLYKTPTYKTVKRARALRKRMTDAELILWQYLRRRQMLGLPFRRQHPIGPYIADFACLPLQLVIEVDGATHASTEEEAPDARRIAFLKSKGWTVIRVFNVDVYNNLDGVLEAIHSQLAALKAANNNVDKDENPRSGKDI